MFAPAKHTENQATKNATQNTPFFGSSGSRPFFQAKLTVNQPGDAHEQEADQVADQVMRMQEGDTPIVQRMPLTPVSSVMRACAECEKEKMQRKETSPTPALPSMGGSIGDVSGKAAPSIVSDVLSSGGGQPMESGTRQFMESRFGQDFSQVRIHTGSQAAESASAIQARAYTSGRDVVFGNGEYQPGSEGGKRLLAHELVHVGQQEGGGVGRINRRTAPNACPGGVTFSTGNHPVHVPLCGITNVQARTTPANISGIQWSLQAATGNLPTGTTIDPATGAIVFDAAQQGGTLQVTAEQPNAAGGGTCDAGMDLELNSHPTVINSTTVIGPPPNAAQNYGAAFDHDFISADGNQSSLERLPVGEQFIGVPNPTGTSHNIPNTPFGAFTLSTANLTPNANRNWFITNGSLGGTHDRVTMGRAGVNVGRFLPSASNPTPAHTLPASFTLQQGLHWFCRQHPVPGQRWTQFALVDHKRELRLNGTDVEFVVSVNNVENVDAYTGQPAVINAVANPVTIPATARRQRGQPAPIPNTSTITAESRPDPMPTGHNLRFSIQGARRGCSINATTGVLTAGTQTGSVVVRVRDSVRANQNFDEVTVQIT